MMLTADRSFCFLLFRRSVPPCAVPGKVPEQNPACGLVLITDETKPEQEASECVLFILDNTLFGENSKSILRLTVSLLCHRKWSVSAGNDIILLRGTQHGGICNLGKLEVTGYYRHKCSSQNSACNPPYAILRNFTQESASIFEQQAAEI